MGSFFESTSAISEEGVIGYPAKKLHPAANAASAQAILPCIIFIFLFGIITYTPFIFLFRF